MLPFIGHAYEIVGSLSNIWPKTKDVGQFCVENGGVVYTKLGSQIYYFITDPDDALTVANTCLQKHFSYTFLKPWLGTGLFTAPAEPWKRHRKLLIPAFTSPVVHTFLDIFNRQARKLVNNVECHVGKGQFDHIADLRNNALETFCMTSFGINGLEDKDLVNKYMVSADLMMRNVMARFQYLWLHSDIIYWLLGYKKRDNELTKTLNKMSDEIIQSKKLALKTMDNDIMTTTTGKKYKPFLDLVLELSSGGAMTDREIGDELDTVVFAGFDTTSNTLVSVLVMLGAYPEVQQRAYEEIMQVVGADRDVEKDDINKLEYLGAVLMETMRMFPAGPLMPRAVLKDVKLKNYTLRAGTSCVLIPAGMHFDFCWGDRFKFRPERWLDPTTVPKNSFAGFGIGKRNCIGKTYAMTAMKISVAHFLRRFKVTASEDNLKLRLHAMLKATGTIEMAQYCIDHGGIFHGKFGSEIYYFITDPEDALTAANACLEKHYVYHLSSSWLGNGLVTAPVNIWKHHRKLLLPTFSLPVVHSFLDILNEQAKKLVSRVEEHVENGQFEHVNYLRNNALETFCLTSFGVNGVEDKDFVSKYMTAADSMMRHVMITFHRPWLQNDVIGWLLGHKKKEKELVKTLRKMSDEVIQRKKIAMRTKKNQLNGTSEDGVKYKAFLDLLLEQSADGSLTDKEIGEELDTAIFAGFDTTSNTLVSVLIMLGAYPEVQQRVYDEIIQTIGKDRDVEKDDVKKLVYLEAVLMETMRMFPSAPLFLRSVDKDVKLKNYTLRKGSSCAIFATGMHYDYCWGDRFRFRPERWLDLATLPKNSFAGFSIGKRNCIGKTYAVIAMKIAVAHFVRRYKILSSEDNLQLSVDILLKAKGTIAIKNRVKE
ncbi:uncharacterized protein LOC142983401 [Anticarsia gemmatalis]|uniref:uncharacterized protein LOC142983401 n=1 Tax=Anticarsia gemmatalis TaxID=129554 RepID=UPI003F76C043